MEMQIYIGADHRGFELKEYLKKFLTGKGYTVLDVGASAHSEDDDYPDFAEAVARAVSVHYETNRGILICGSGVGVDVVANKFRNVRSVLASTPDQAYDSRNDDNTNVLCLGANYLTSDEARNIVTTWLQTPYSEETRHNRRLKKVFEIEQKYTRPIEEVEENMEG